MSTYTDIQNRIKENIAANAEDRAVSAKVVFSNRENIYYGSFLGAVTASELDVPDDFFDEVSLNGPILINPVLSCFAESEEAGVQTARLDFEDLRSISCAVRSIKDRLTSKFQDPDPAAYSISDVVSVLIDLKNSLSGF